MFGIFKRVKQLEEQVELLIIANNAQATSITALASALTNQASSAHTSIGLLSEKVHALIIAGQDVPNTPEGTD